MCFLSFLFSGLDRQTEDDDDSSNEDSCDDAKQDLVSQDSRKDFELEKLKQLQSLYKMNMVQQQFPQPPSSVQSQTSQPGQPPMSVQNSLPVDMDFGFLSSLKAVKKPALSGSASSANSSQDNVSYVEMLHQKATAGGKTPSRRPLSSWKQSISACGPGPAPWVDKSTLYSLGIQGNFYYELSFHFFFLSFLLF